MTIRTNSTLNIQHSTLLFIHGWATDSWVWRNQVREFSKDYNVISINLPGYSGKDNWTETSLQPAIDKVLRITHRTAHSTDLVGISWSLGASVLMSIAVKEPEIFKGLILVGATPCFVKRNDFPWSQSKPLAKRMLRDLKNDPEETLSRFYPLNFTDKELADKEAQGFIRHYHSSLITHHSSLLLSLEALLNLDMRDDIKKIKAKTLVIHGSKDAVCPVGAGEYIAKNIKDVCLEIFKDAGHAPFLSRAELFNQAVREFLKRL